MTTHIYTKQELARAYAPNLTPKSALNRLMLWINSNHPLSHALTKSGYVKTQKQLSTRQVTLIFRYLGQPLNPQP